VHSRALTLLISCAVLIINSAWAGGSGLNVIVVVNQNSTNSVQLGNDYCELRGVPPQNVLRITNWTGGNVSWSTNDFQSDLLNPMLVMLNSRGLNRQAQFILLSMDIPYRVTDGSSDNSTTAALFYGFKTNGAPVSGFGSCSLPDNTSNSYAYSELSFAQAPPNTAATNSFLAMMLTDTSLAAAENILRSSVASDYSYPTQAVYLAKTSDAARNVRFVEFDNAVFENQVVGNHAISRIDSDSTAFTNLAGLMTGLANYTLPANAFVPGTFADTLTSFAGELFESTGQTPLLAFLDAGAAGSYGTVVEPCNYTQKFPDPVDYFYQTRGFALAEACYQSVLNPFQGLFAGEPLAAPSARPGTANWNSLTNGAMLGGQVNLSPTFTAGATNLPLNHVDLFVDGTFYETMTNLPPVAGNLLTAVLNGKNVSYTIPTNATLGSIASGFATALDFQTSLTHIMATAAGDRVELQSQDIYLPGSNVTASAISAAGSAATLTTFLNTARPAFLDTVATGYQVASFYNAPIVGDWIQVAIMKTNGITVTLGVTNSVSGTTIGTLAQNLFNQINANSILQSADGALASDFFDADPYGQASAQFNLYARTPGWPASQVLVTWTTSTNLQATPTGMNPLADNVSDLRPRNHLYISVGTNSLAVNFPLDTTQLPDGCHQLTAVAYEGTSVSTQTRITRNIIIQNTSLSATIAALPAGSNASVNQPLQFTVAADGTNISRIELFSTGGSQGVVSNQAAAVFNVSAAYLGLGLHPFYAVVTDQSGHRYQTQTLSYRIVPTITMTVTRNPFTLTWATVPSNQYDVQFTTNLAASFQSVTTLTATNSLLSWLVATTNSGGFYRIKLGP
jgi:uncharacterized protein (TIGR03790 family)